MDVRLSPEQRALRESAAQVVSRLGPPTVRDLDDDERKAKLDAAVEASGWRELRAAGEGRRPLATAVEAALVAEELGAGVADVAFLGPLLAADLRRLARADADPTRRQTVLLAADLGDLATFDRGPAEDGAAPPVAVDAAGAVLALALQPGPAPVGVVTVPVGPVTGGTDLTRPSALHDAAAAPAPAAIGAITPADLDRWRALALALACADLVGAMRGAVTLGCGYVTDRRQYGVPVGSFQAVQHLLADAHVATEGSRSVALHAAWAVDALEPGEALSAGAVAKAYCARAALSVAETVIQVHGGTGNTWECRAHLYLRRCLLSIDVLGGVGPNLERILAGRGLGGADGLL